MAAPTYSGPYRVGRPNEYLDESLIGIAFIGLHGQSANNIHNGLNSGFSASQLSLQATMEVELDGFHANSTDDYGRRHR